MKYSIAGTQFPAVRISRATGLGLELHLHLRYLFSMPLSSSGFELPFVTLDAITMIRFWVSSGDLAFVAPKFTAIIRIGAITSVPGC